MKLNIFRHQFWHWSGLIIISLYLLITSALVTSPAVTNENILIALRLSSLTTAIAFWLVFATKSIIKLNYQAGSFLQENRRYLWLMATISHLIHLYQIFLYYQLGNSCPLMVWLITSPLWILMTLFAVVEIFQPQLLDGIISPDKSNESNKYWNFFYRFSLWYIWLVFTIAFSLGTIAKQLIFYNLPASILYLAAAIIPIVFWCQQKVKA